MAQYDDNNRISGISLGTAPRINAINYRKQYNEMLAKLTGGNNQKLPPLFGNGFAASNGVTKASTDFNG